MAAISCHRLIVVPELDRQFDVSAPHRVWTADITYIPTREDWLYLVVVMDLYTRTILDWSIGRKMTRELAMDALRMARFGRNPAPGVLHHSDRGRPVLQSRLTGAADRVRHDVLDEPQGELL